MTSMRFCPKEKYHHNAKVAEEVDFDSDIDGDEGIFAAADELPASVDCTDIKLCKAGPSSRLFSSPVPSKNIIPSAVAFHQRPGPY